MPELRLAILETRDSSFEKVFFAYLHKDDGPKVETTCGHNHRSRDAAEKCGEKLLKKHAGGVK